jgi:hypothetical protein
MRFTLPKVVGTMLLGLCTLASGPALAQQFNSDNYLSKPHGVATIILTTGERNLMWMTTFSLFPRWEFTAAAYLFTETADRTAATGYSTSYYAKWMLYENQAKTGGLAVKGGTGLEPGYVNNSVKLEDAFRTYWVNAPLTLAFFDNRLSWDIMPGASLSLDDGEDAPALGAFSYATRLAWYPFNPKLAIAGEVYGAEGGAEAIPEYRVGLRWEPSQYAVFALTYDDEFDGTKGAGVEFGVMLFTPPFARLGGSD